MTAHLIEETLSSEEVFRGVFFHITRDRVRLSDGHETVREYIKHPGAVAIVALTDAGQIVMEHQYRHPVGKVFLEIPAGKLDPAEPPLACAQRELLEETGYQAARWQHLGTIHPCIGYADEHIEIFLARSLTKTERQLDDGELLDVVELSFDGVLASVMQGAITDAKTISALFFAERALRQGF
ncbi:MAG: hypothetical protein RIR70_1229 [Pseudomonadota bacterium]|jgi:ADP-ribose pyrophosphatase